MIYQMYFGIIQRESNPSSFGDAKPVNYPEMVADHLEQTNDTLVFIVTLEQQGIWDKVFQRYWKKYLHAEMPYMVTNISHPDLPRRLRVYVLKGIKNAS